jgi:hypothetical protein
LVSEKMFLNQKKYFKSVDCGESTVVGHSTHDPVTMGSNPAVITGRDQNGEKRRKRKIPKVLVVPCYV